MNPSLRSAFLRLLGLALLGLFLLPGVTWWFVGYAEGRYTEEMRTALDSSLAAERELSAEMQTGLRAQLQTLTARGLCAGDYPMYEDLRHELCAPSADLGQFGIARQVSIATLWLGIGTLAWILALALLAHQRPRLQITAFTAGWWSLRLVSALEVLLQAAMLVWLSYWLTAVFFEVYVVKLILIAAALAGMGVWVAISAIFRSVPADNQISGALISEAQAPALWSRIRQFSLALKTAAPTQLIGGIDANFFVTEAPLRLQDRALQGRTLFVSLPLLRVLGREEADAVLAHELAHFSGGDTAASAALGPKLHAYGQYMAALGQAGLTLLAFFVLNLFRVAFELALSRDSREREYRADQQAVRLTSAPAMARALVKVAAYSSYRQSVEAQLFDQNQRHEGPLGLAGRVAAGLSAFAQSADFQTVVTQASIPHPFDSHPPLQQRMQAAGAAIPAEAYAAIVSEPPQQSWIDLIEQADALEAPQWQQYESGFAAEHEQSLAVRYEPANEAERLIVLKYFPDQVFALKKGGQLRISYEGIDTPEQPRVSWDAVKAIQYDDGSFGTRDTLTITHPTSGTLGLAQTTRLHLAIATSDRDAIKEALGRHWQRHQIMRKLQAGT